MSRFARGYIRDAAEKRTQQPHHVLLAARGLTAVATPGGSADLTKYEAPIMDQGQFGSCTGHGTSQAVYTALNAKGKKLPFVPSQVDPYTGGRARARAQTWSGVGDPPKLTDDGAMPADVMAYLTAVGVRPSRGPTADGRLSDCDAANVNAEPKLDQLEEDVVHVVVGQYRIDEASPTVVDQVCLVLDQNVPVGIGAFVDTAFEEWSPGTSPIPSPDLNDPQGGGHWFVISGYTTVNGKRVFRITNSWGTGWGDAGHAFVSAEFVAAAWDLYAMDVELKSAKEAA